MSGVFFGEFNIRDVLKPVSGNEELVQILQKFPINFNGKDSRGNPFFKYKDDLFEEINMAKDRLLGGLVENSMSLPEHAEQESADQVDDREDVKSPEPEAQQEKQEPVRAARAGRPKKEEPKESNDIPGW